MGLLDFGALDPGTTQTLALAGGLLSPGSFGQGLSKGIAGAQQAAMNTQEMEIKKQALEMQRLQFAAAFRNQNLINEYLAQGMGGGTAPTTSSSSGALGAGAAVGDVGPTNSNAARIGGAPPSSATPGPFGGLPTNQWLPDLAFNGGKGIASLVKDYNTPTTARANGFLTYRDGRVVQLPEAAPGYTLLQQPDGSFKQVPVEGGPEGFARAAALKEQATMRAKNAETPIPLERLDRYAGNSPGLSASLDDLLHPTPSAPTSSGDASAPPRSSMRIPPAVQAARDSDAYQIIKNEYDNEPPGPNKAALARELLRFSRGSANGGSGLGQMKSPADLSAERLAAENDVKLRTEPGVTYANDQAKKASDYGDLLNAKVQTGQDLMMRMAEARKALDQFQPGMGAEGRLQVARFAQAIGAPDSLVRRLNLGDVSAKQEFMKLSAQTAMESLKQSMGGAGRITQAEFKVFQQNNPNIELDKDAITKIYDFATRVYQREFSEQQARQQYIANGGDPVQWPAVWSKTLDPRGNGLISAPGTATPLGIDQDAIAAELRRRQQTGAR